MDQDLKKQLQKIADTLRHLSIDAIEKASSGHPGLPLGAAEIGAYLYGYQLNHSPKNPSWINRDRLVLSAGHGSMWLYSCLHLSGFDLPMDEIKHFRQLHSKTPGHPEHALTAGVEAVAGPLGQGVGNAVGMALGIKILAEKFNTDEYELFNSKVYCLAGDGCMMEGASHEACSLAGHLNLDNLVLIYDANDVTLDGPLSDSCSEDTRKRFESYGWDVFSVDGHDFDSLDIAFSSIRERQKKPVLIIAKTIIGKGAPHKQGNYKIHGAPLGAEEVKATKEALKLPEEEFYVPQAVYDFFSEKNKRQQILEEEWDDLYRRWSNSEPKLAAEFLQMENFSLPQEVLKGLKALPIKPSLASRSSSHEVINYLSDQLPYLYGGSADLSSSDQTFMDHFSAITPNHFKGRNIKYGDREFAMGTITSGLSLTGMILPFCGTFLTFSDYLRNAIRLAALSSLPVIYQFTHDSVFLGEDGPTHQPVEQIASLRAMPRLQVIRPADSWEVKMAWIAALAHQGPTALILSRQSLPDLKETVKFDYEKGLGKGAYIIKEEKKKPDFTLFATGSEVKLALDVAQNLESLGKDVRVVSFPCWELFEKQSQAYRNQIIGGDIGKRVSIEAAVEMGWAKYIGREGIAISIDDFGFSAPGEVLKQEFGFFVDAIVQRLLY